MTTAEAIAPAQTDGVPVEYFLEFIESDPLVSPEDLAWFRALLGTRPLLA